MNMDKFIYNRNEEGNGVVLTIVKTNNFED